jgi:hypothetical protein
MGEMFRGLRCRPGDLAVIVQDEPECQANIGQIVRVLKVSYEFPDWCGFYWDVQPLSSEASPVLISPAPFVERRVIYDNKPRAHLDAWLRPLLDTEEPDEISRAEDRSDESEWRDPAHLRVTSGSPA